MTEEINIEARFEEFLRIYQDEKGNYKYRERAKEMAAEGMISLIIDFDDLLRFDPELARILLSEPAQVLSAASNALRNLMQIIDNEYASSVRNFHVRIKNLPTTIPLRKIRSSEIGKLIQIKGILTRASKVKPLLHIGAFKCGSCGAITYKEQEEGRYSPPLVCRSCGRKGPFKLLEDESTFIDWQNIRIQERPEELPAGQLPRFIDAIVTEDLVDSARPGDRVTIVGILRSTLDTRTAGKLATFSTYIETVYIEREDKEVEEVYISKEEEKEILEFAKDPFASEKLIASIAPSIYGLRHIKEAIALMLFGGVTKELPDGVKIRGEINVLLVGDPGTGKSQLLKYATKIAPRAIYTTGKGSTAAGLTAAVVRDSMTGSMTLEAGALVLADRGLAAIDEFDKMQKDDRSAIHEAMEQQTISIAKAGIIATLNARTAILAAANPIFGRYDTYKTAAENINLPATILSRFDLIFVLTDKPDPKMDKELVTHVLRLHQRPHEMQEDILPTEFLKKYIAYARKNIHPKLTEEAAKILEAFYLELRARSSSSSVAITTRQLEALVRLAEAHARMELRDVITEKDAKAAIRLMKLSLQQVAFDETTESIDIDRILVGKPRSQLEQMSRVLDIIIELERETGGPVPITKVIEVAEEEGIPRNFAKKVIDDLKNDGTIYEPKPGFVKKA